MARRLITSDEVNEEQKKLYLSMIRTYYFEGAYELNSIS